MIRVRIVTPKGVYKETDTEILNVLTIDGQQGILTNHLPVVTILKTGVINMEENGKRENYFCGDGVLYFRDAKAEILTDLVQHASEIDAEQAEKDRLEAESALTEKSTRVAYAVNKKKLMEAEARLKAVAQQNQNR